MAKKIISDIVKVNPIRISNGVKRKTRATQELPRKQAREKEEGGRETIDLSFLVKKAPRAKKTASQSAKKPWRKFLFYFAGAIIFFIIAFFLAGFFASAEIKIFPKQERVNIDFNASASRGNLNGSGVDFEIVQLEYEDILEISPQNTEEVKRKASGQIIIYNAFSSSPQVLIANTRFETPDGKIYRIDKRVTAPGTKLKNGKAIPGEIEVTAYADQPGESFNIGLADFTIPGFKGDSRYEKIYARSKTEMKGGYIGLVPVISEEEDRRAAEQLKERITKYIEENIAKQKPDDYVFYNSALVVDFDDLAESQSAGSANKTMNFKQKGSGTGFLISRGNLQNEIVRRYLTEDFVGEVRIENLDKLEFVLLENNSDKTEIKFNLRGEARFVRKINKDVLVEDLMSSKGDYESVFKNYSAIERAEILFKPAWWRSLPKDKSKIKITEVLK